MRKFILTLFSILLTVSLFAQRDTVPGWKGFEVPFNQYELTWDSVSVLCDAVTDTTCYIGPFFDTDSTFVTGYTNIEHKVSTKAILPVGQKLTTLSFDAKGVRVRLYKFIRKK